MNLSLSRILPTGECEFLNYVTDNPKRYPAYLNPTQAAKIMGKLMAMNDGWLLTDLQGNIKGYTYAKEPNISYYTHWKQSSYIKDNQIYLATIMRLHNIILQLAKNIH